MSVFDFVHNDNLYLVYNDLAENLKAEKIKEFNAEKNDSDIFLATSSDKSVKKFLLTRDYTLYPRKSRSSDERVILVGYNHKEKKTKLGILKINK